MCEQNFTALIYEKAKKREQSIYMYRYTFELFSCFCKSHFRLYVFNDITESYVLSPKSLLIQTNQIHSIIIFSHLDHQLIHRHILHFVTFRHFVLLLSFLAQKKCTPCLISWTYADKLHTFSLQILYFTGTFIP